MRVIDEIVTELAEHNLIGKMRYLVTTTDNYKELESDFKYEFGSLYFDLEREPSKDDLEEYFKLKILIDDKQEKYKGGKKYLFLAANRADNL